MTCLLGIDVGTIGLKSAIFDPKGNMMSMAYREYHPDTPHPGWYEQDPDVWWNATVETVREAIGFAKVDPKDIAGVSLCSMYHTPVFIGRDGKPLRSSIIWLDQRNIPQLNWIKKKADDLILDRTGTVIATCHTAPTLLWVKENQPKILEDTKTILMPNDYVRYRLTDVLATDVDQASGTVLFDNRKLEWSQEILSALKIPSDILPPVAPSSAISGEVTYEAAEATGLKSGTPVAAGGGDCAATMLGMGVMDPGQLGIIIGTAGITITCFQEYAFDSKKRCFTIYHLVPGRWLIFAITNAAGASLRWFRDNFCREEMERAEKERKSAYTLMDQEASESPPGSSGMIFLPYVSGERTPHWDPYARGIFAGCSLWHKKSDFIRSVLEGVAFSLYDCVAVLDEVSAKYGDKITDVRLAGGGVKSNLWRQILADILGREVSIPSVSELGALGCSINAAVGAKLYRSYNEAVENMVRIQSGTKPNLDLKNSVYDKLHKAYTQIYQSSRPVNDVLMEFQGQSS